MGKEGKKKGKRENRDIKDGVANACAKTERNRKDK